jgi:hypothetical protein
VLRSIFGPKREEMVEHWRRLHSEELHNFYTSPNIIRVIKSRRMRWAGDGKCIQNRGRKNVEGRDHSVDLGLDEIIMLE